MAGNIVLGSATFLVAVTGLLVPAPPQPPRRRAPSARNSADGGNGYGSFETSAWKHVDPSPQAGTEAAASIGDALRRHTRDNGEDRGEAEEEAIDVDVDKLPTFVIFGRADDGRYWREDVVGGGNARTCEAKLKRKLTSLQSLPASGDDALPQPSASGDGGAGAGIGGEGESTDGDRRGIAAGNRDSERDGGSDKVTNSFEEMTSKDDLLRLLGGRRKGQDPVVVMYHAPWCRKCAYLTPVFRRLAAAQMPAAAEGRTAVAGGDIDGADSVSATSPADGTIFCRADVSHPSWARKAVSSAAAEETAAAAATAVATAEAEESGGAAGVGVGTLAGTTAAPDAAPARAVRAMETETELSLHTGSPAVENCDVCCKTGFVPCGECEGRGAVARSSPDGKHTVAVTCPVCVGYKRLRCPACGGKCYMCD